MYKFAILGILFLGLFSLAGFVDAATGDASSTTASGGGSATIAEAINAEKQIAIETPPMVEPDRPYYTTEIAFYPGWNMFSTFVEGGHSLSGYEDNGIGEPRPLIARLGGKISYSTCNIGNVYHYNAYSRQYSKGEQMKVGSIYNSKEGYWFKATETCKIQIVGDRPITESEFDGLRLYKGWNQLGSASSQIDINAILGTCSITSGPWRYDPLRREYVKEKLLQPSQGYFMKVLSDCKLSSDDSPPQPPDPTPTVYPTITVYPTATTIPDKKIIIEEFADFECPFCARAQPTLRQVEAHYGPAVITRVYKHFPLSAIHPYAWKAAEAYECASKFYDGNPAENYRDMLFENQANLDISDLKNYASKLGINRDFFDKCLDSGMMSYKVQNDYDEGLKRGVTGTPTFFINGVKLVGAQPYESFKKIIDDLLQGIVTPTVYPTATTIPSDAPDLYVTSEPATPAGVGEYTKIKYTIKNIGKGKAANSIFYVAYGDYGALAHRGGIPALAPGESYTVSTSILIPDVKVLEITAVADWENTIRESNEDNNQWKITLYPNPQVTPTATTEPLRFDPAAIDIKFNPSNPAAGKDFEVTAVVQNLGTDGGYIDSVSLGFSGGGEGTNVGGGTGASVGGSIYLKPGEYYFLKSTNTFPTGGWWTGTITVYAKNDYDSGNNYYAEKIYVTPYVTPTPTSQPTCPSISGDGTFSVRVGCSAVSNGGHTIKLSSISSYNPMQVKIEISNKYGEVLKTTFLTAGESFLMPEENNLFIQVNAFAVADGSGGSSYYVDLTVKTNYGGEDLPDLTVSTTGISNPVVGTIAKLPFTIQNIGKAKAGFSIAVTSGITAQGFTIPSLAPGEKYSGEVSFYVPDKDHIEVTLQADSTRLIVESNEDNNQFRYDIYPVRP